MRKADFTNFPSNSPGKARGVLKLYLGVKSKLRKKRTVVLITRDEMCVMLDAQICHAVPFFKDIAHFHMLLI